MEYYAALINQRDPSLENVFCFVDGVWLQIQNPPDEEDQNAYYNTWKSCTNISNVICFAPDGTIIWARYNCPGMAVIKCHKGGLGLPWRGATMAMVML